MAYQRKTHDEWDIEAYTGSQYGWEVVNTETTRQDARRSIKEYRDNQPEYAYRLKYHRVKNDTPEVTK